MKEHTQSSRRSALKQMAGSALALGSAGALSSFSTMNDTEQAPLKGRINHSVCRWPFDYLSLDEFCAMAKELGLKAVDLLTPSEWPTAKKYGLDCSMCYTAGKISLTKGWNDPSLHPQLIAEFKEAIPLVAAAGFKNLICFSGNRDGMDDMVGLKNCANGLKQIMKLAEQQGVIIQMELFNSKIDHADYMADKSSWGVKLCKEIGSDNFKLLYDIYHMQINEGDVIRTIQNDHQYFGHYHTAGVPGRHEIGDNQELYYPAIMRAIADTGYKGYVAQEYKPTGKSPAQKKKDLQTAIRICDI